MTRDCFKTSVGRSLKRKQLHISPGDFNATFRSTLVKLVFASGSIFN